MGIYSIPFHLFVVFFFLIFHHVLTSNIVVDRLFLNQFKIEGISKWNSQFFLKQQTKHMRMISLIHIKQLSKQQTLSTDRPFEIVSCIDNIIRSKKQQSWKIAFNDLHYIWNKCNIDTCWSYCFMFNATDCVYNVKQFQFNCNAFIDSYFL